MGRSGRRRPVSLAPVSSQRAWPAPAWLAKAWSVRAWARPLALSAPEPAAPAPAQATRRHCGSRFAPLLASNWTRKIATANRGGSIGRRRRIKIPARRADRYEQRASGETAGDLFAGRKAAGRLLRVRQSVVNANLEDAAARPQQAQLRRGPQFKDQFPRLTGARFIASLTAVFDLDLHESVL